MGRWNMEAKCSSLEPVLPCLCAPSISVARAAYTHTYTTLACIGTQVQYSGTHEHLRLPWPLLVLLSPSLGAFIPLRATRAYYPPRFASCSLFGCRTAGGHSTALLFSSCHFERARVRDWSQGATHLLLWLWPWALVHGAGFWCLACSLQLRLDHPVLLPTTT